MKTVKASTHNCCAQVQRHRITTIQRVALFNSGTCTRKGRIEMTRSDNGSTHHMCQQHAKLALQGFIDKHGNVASNATRNDYQTGRVCGLPSDFGLWKADDADLQHIAEHFKQDIECRRKAELAFRNRKDQRLGR